MRDAFVAFATFVAFARAMGCRASSCSDPAGWPCAPPGAASRGCFRSSAPALNGIGARLQPAAGARPRCRDPDVPASGMRARPT
ncbi:hypothetical protein DF043_15545 [Burkholderia cepacia]|nr:hypothetical protein DF043_15545 [Burkholderia cepacia]